MEDSPCYCPQCGGRLVRTLTVGPEPGRPACPDCGRSFHLDPKVAACALIVRDGAVLLVRRARPPARGTWCFPGGFVDRGETLEAAAAREAWEETALRVNVRRLFGLYSYTGYPIVAAIYEADISSGELAPNEECLEAAWFRPEDVPWDGLAFPSTIEALRAWSGVKGPAGSPTSAD